MPDHMSNKVELNLDPKLLQFFSDREKLTKQDISVNFQKIDFGHNLDQFLDLLVTFTLFQVKRKLNANFDLIQTDIGFVSHCDGKYSS